MGKGGQIWLKCITGDLIMMIRDKNNIFERVENFHADLAWNYPSTGLDGVSLGEDELSIVNNILDQVDTALVG